MTRPGQCRLLGTGGFTVYAREVWNAQVCHISPPKVNCGRKRLFLLVLWFEYLQALPSEETAILCPTNKRTRLKRNMEWLLHHSHHVWWSQPNNRQDLAQMQGLSWTRHPELSAWHSLLPPVACKSHRPQKLFFADLLLKNMSAICT